MDVDRSGLHDRSWSQRSSAVARDEIDDLHPEVTGADISELERFLAAGINVVTTARLVSGMHYPGDAGERLRRAALEGSASLFGTGMNPMHVPAVALASG